MKNHREIPRTIRAFPGSSGTLRSTAEMLFDEPMDLCLQMPNFLSEFRA
jgi:hypothetical protein